MKISRLKSSVGSVWFESFGGEGRGGERRGDF